VSDLRKVTELTCIVMSCFSCFTIVPKSTGLARPSDNQPVGVNLMPTFEHSELGQSELEHKIHKRDKYVPCTALLAIYNIVIW